MKTIAGLPVSDGDYQALQFSVTDPDGWIANLVSVFPKRAPAALAEKIAAVRLDIRAALGTDADDPSKLAGWSTKAAREAEFSAFEASQIAQAQARPSAKQTIDAALALVDPTKPAAIPMLKAIISTLAGKVRD